MSQTLFSCFASLDRRTKKSSSLFVRMFQLCWGCWGRRGNGSRGKVGRETGQKAKSVAYESGLEIQDKDLPSITVVDEPLGSPPVSPISNTDNVFSADDGSLKYTPSTPRSSQRAVASQSTVSSYQEQKTLSSGHGTPLPNRHRSPSPNQYASPSPSRKSPSPKRRSPSPGRRSPSPSHGSPLPSRRSPASQEEEEGFIDRIMHKILPQAEDTSEPTKGSPQMERASKRTSHLSVNNREISIGSSPHEQTVTSQQVFRPRSNTLDPPSTRASARRHSYTTQLHVKYARSDGKVNSAADTEGTRRMSVHEKRVQEAKEKYMYTNTGRTGSGSTPQRPASADRSKTGSTTLLKPTARNADANTRQRPASFGQIDQLRQKMAERGEKVDMLETRTESMRHATQSLSQSANMLADKYKNKKWYEW